MRYLKISLWGFFPGALLLLTLLQASRTATAANSAEWGIVQSVGAPVQSNEVQESALGWQIVGQVGGSTTAVAVQGNYAYVGVGLRLVVLNVSAPANPQEVGATTPFPYFVEDVVVSGTLAYVATGGAGLRVVDISNPAVPVEIGVWDSPGYAEGVAVAGSIAYLADGPYGLWIVDVSNPTHPTPVATAYDMNYAFEVALSGEHAYIAAAGAGILVAEVSDPMHPVEVASLDTPGYAYGVEVSGTVAYVADGWQGVRVFNVSDPALPTEVGSYQTPGWAFDVDVVGTEVYIADAFGGLRVLEVGDPAQITEIASFAPIRGHAGKVLVVGDIGYVADQNWGLWLIDLSESMEPVQLGFFGSTNNAQAITVAGDYAYVAAMNSGLRVMDVSDPSHPAEVGAYDLRGEQEGFANCVAVSGHYAYMGNIEMIFTTDVSDPNTPSLASRAPLTVGVARDLAIDGETLYVADEWGLELMNLSNPASPTHIGHTMLMEELEDRPGEPAATDGIVVSGTLAYVTLAAGGLKIVDVANPISPSLVGWYKTDTSYTGDVAVSGNLAYLAETSDGRKGVQVVDVSDPIHPSALGFYDTPGEAVRLIVSGTLVYVADGSHGLSVVDVSDPLNPTLTDSIDTPGFAYDVTVREDLVYLADGYGGILILQSGQAAQQQEMGDQAIHDWEVRQARALALPRSAPVRPQAITWVVTATNDIGPGTLRQALSEAQPGDVIVFDPLVFSPTHPQTITINSQLPAMTGNVTVDARSTGVIVDGQNTPPGDDGFGFLGNNCMVEGLKIVNFGGDGVVIRVGAQNTTIRDNVIEGNQNGVRLQDPDTEDNLIVDNTISANWLDGVVIQGGAQGNYVQGNVIHDNRGDGVGVRDAASLSNTLTENAIFGNSGQGIATTDGGNGELLPPVVEAVTLTTVLGIAPPNARVEIFSDKSDEGEVYEGSTLADASGAFNFYTTALTGPNITATATDAEGNTSAFSTPKTLFKITYTYTVTTVLDQGEGSLRQALLDADHGHTITFDPLVFSPTHPVTITSESALPPISQGNLTIDASNAGVILNGSQLASGEDGLSLISNGNIVMGLQILRFPGSGIAIYGDNNIIGGDLSLGIGLTGQGNVVSGNGQHGIMTGGAGNVIVGNLIGTDASGTKACGNGGHGVSLGGWNNHVGGPDPRDRNIISGNAENGIYMGGISYGNTVIGNYVGTDIAGQIDLGNEGNGISAELGGFDNLIQGNLSSGNGRTGIYLGDWGSDYNTVIGNLVGIDAGGTRSIPNDSGIGINSRFNRIGGSLPEERNIINGIGVSEHAAENLILGNYVGTDVTGSQPINSQRGLTLWGNRSLVEGNVFSGNPHPGIVLGVGADYNYIAHNLIGISAAGDSRLGNDGDGIITSGEHNVIQDNSIAFNSGAGVNVIGSPYNTIRRNSIYNHPSQGIVLIDGGNNALPAPIIINVTSTSLSGTTCPGCTVEIFSDEEDEGWLYEGYATADGSGSWIWTGNPNGPYVTATATDEAGNTSEFSVPLKAWRWVYLPLVLGGGY